jgi:neutral trehalase
MPYVNLGPVGAHRSIEYPSEAVLPLLARTPDMLGDDRSAYDPELHRQFAREVIQDLCIEDVANDTHQGDAPRYLPPSLRWPGVFQAMCLAEVRTDGIDNADVKLRPGVTDAVVAKAWRAYQEGLLGPITMNDFSEMLFDFPVRMPVETVRRPELPLGEYSQDVMRRSTHIANLDIGSQIGVSKPIQSPGGRFDVRKPGEGRLFFWDAWPTTQGGVTMGEWGVEQLGYTLDNFTELAQKLDGCVPNVNATWAIRPQPNVLGRLVRQEARLKGTNCVSDERLNLLEMHLDYLDRGSDNPDRLGMEPGSAHRFTVRMPNGKTMYRFYDEGPDQGRAWRDEMMLTDLQIKRQREEQLGRELTSEESRWLSINLGTGAGGGEDYSPDECADFRTLATIRSAELVSVKQNALMCDTFNLLAFEYGQRAEDESYDPVQRQQFRAKAALNEARGFDLAECINEYCIGETGIPANYDFVNGETLPGMSLTGVFALSSGIFPANRGRQMLHNIDQRFVFKGGAKNTLWETKERFNWDNAWPIMEGELVDAAIQYGELELALKWCDTFLERDEAAYEKYGCLFEKYDPFNKGEPGGGGEYECVRDLLMSHGIHLKLRALRPRIVAFIAERAARLSIHPRVGAMAVTGSAA